MIHSSEDILCPVRETVDLAEPSETTDAADVDLLDFVHFPDLLEAAEQADATVISRGRTRSLLCLLIRPPEA